MNDTNVSDLDWVELPDGSLYLEWAMGCQDPAVPNCHPALYAISAATTAATAGGGERAWLAAAFENPAALEWKRATETLEWAAGATDATA